MVDDPRDPTAYRIAIAFLGLALVTILAGISWVCAEHLCVRNIPVQLWFAACAIGGVLVGVLIPFSIYKRAELNSHESPLVPATEARIGAALLAFAAVAAGAVGAIADHLLALSGVGTVLAGVFFGLFIPSPGRRDP